MFKDVHKPLLISARGALWPTLGVRSLADLVPPWSDIREGPRDNFSLTYSNRVFCPAERKKTKKEFF